MRTYLVTGGAGFIGSNYIHYMFEKYGDEINIINVDNPPIIDERNTLLYFISYFKIILVVINNKKSIHILRINNKSRYINISPPFIVYKLYK